MKKHTYVLGTGLSHNGSACLLKDGKIAYAIEKERITRYKHDGENDTVAIQYCLEAEGITLNDVDLVVQNANFGFFEFGNNYYNGNRLFTENVDVPVITISHHLAHAYNAIGTSPYKDSAILIMDGCGSPIDECIDLHNGVILPEKIQSDLRHIYAEKDSFYLFENNNFKSVYKDFSPLGMRDKEYPMHPGSTLHSIGGVFGAVSKYCLGNHNDEGKLMGLAPFGDSSAYSHEIFELRDGRIFVRYDWMNHFQKPTRSYKQFQENFKYYANIAAWTQLKVEEAIIYIINSRAKHTTSENLAYSGGLALNAVANARIIKETPFKNIYMTPAAGDNGLSIGCAYYGWMEVLKRDRVMHNGNSCFGKVYTNDEIKNAIDEYILPDDMFRIQAIENFFKILPQCIHIQEENKQDKQITVQFIIKEINGFYLIIQGDKFLSKKGFVISPSCTINTNANAIINALQNIRSFTEFFDTPEATFDGNLEIMYKIKFNEDSIKLFKNLNRKIRINKEPIKFKKVDNVTWDTAKMLSEGKVIGWFNGGCEFGPRALGHRSILADPRRIDIQQFINSKIKFREDFRPFAPSVIKEDVKNYFLVDGDSPYMILVNRVRDEWKDKIPGVVHKNNSCRVQTVTPDWNKEFYDLLQGFKKITGVSVLLNTSFNRKGMPIVETPMDAISFFYECELDAIVMGNYIICKNSNPINEKQKCNAEVYE